VVLLETGIGVDLIFTYFVCVVVVIVSSRSSIIAGVLDLGSLGLVVTTGLTSLPCFPLTRLVVCALVDVVLTLITFGLAEVEVVLGELVDLGATKDEVEASLIVAMILVVDDFGVVLDVLDLMVPLGKLDPEFERTEEIMLEPRMVVVLRAELAEELGVTRTLDEVGTETDEATEEAVELDKAR